MNDDTIDVVDGISDIGTGSSNAVLRKDFPETWLWWNNENAW